MSEDIENIYCLRWSGKKIKVIFINLYINEGGIGMHVTNKNILPA